jgi:hypothetical protein
MKNKILSRVAAAIDLTVIGAITTLALFTLMCAAGFYSNAKLELSLAGIPWDLMRTDLTAGWLWIQENMSIEIARKIGWFWVYACVSLASAMLSALAAYEALIRIRIRIY